VRSAQQSDRHSSITRDHVLSVGPARTQSDQNSVDMTRDHARSAGGEGFSSQIDKLQTSKEITYGLKEQ
jgi:hypothetical protein